MWVKLNDYHVQESSDSRTPTDPNEGRVFSSVISDLRTSYPKEKLDDISTSFCFICLLHLANERGLKIEVDEDDEDALQGNLDDTDSDETRVGNLWGLKVSFHFSWLCLWLVTYIWT